MKNSKVVGGAILLVLGVIALIVRDPIISEVARHKHGSDLMLANNALLYGGYVLGALGLLFLFLGLQKRN